MATGSNRTAAFIALTERMLGAPTREERARLYVGAARELAHARSVAVVWRSRWSLVSVAENGGTAEPVVRRFPPETPAFDTFHELDQRTEGVLELEATRAEWLPPEIGPRGPTVLLLPEGTARGAPRLVIEGADEASLEELHAIVRALRPHWIERRRLGRLSSIDHLTGVYNFRALRRYLKRVCRRTSRDGGRFSILMLDVDRLKEYNSRFGHLMGSSVLAQLGGVLRRVLRQGDFVAKYGGDEFLIVLRGATKANAVDIALRFKEQIGRQAFPGVPSGFITCSIGVATFGEDGTTFDSLVSSADRAIYAAKDRGRNTVIAAEREKSPSEPPDEPLP